MGAVLQARLGSSRLPRKVMLDICGKPALQRVIERTQKIQGLDVIIVAYPAVDKVIGELAQSLGCETFAQLTDSNDVLARYYQAAKVYSLDAIMRITADCPVLDPSVCDRLLDKYLNSKYDYVAATQRSGWPNGLDTEIFSFWTLLMAYENADTPYDREHVTSYMYRQPSPFHISNMYNNLDESLYRWTLDTSADLAWIRNAYITLGTDQFGKDDIIDMIRKYPSMAYYDILQ